MSPDQLLIYCPLKRYKRSWKYGCSKCKHKKFVVGELCGYKPKDVREMEKRRDK